MWGVGEEPGARWGEEGGEEAGGEGLGSVAELVPGGVVGGGAKAFHLLTAVGQRSRSLGPRFQPHSWAQRGGQAMSAIRKAFRTWLNENFDLNDVCACGMRLS